MGSKAQLSKKQALQTARQRFEATFEAAAIGIAHVAPDGSWLYVNQAVSEILGYSHEELLRLRFQDLTHAGDLDRDIHYVEQMLAGDIDNYSIEKRYIRKDGNVVWVNLTVTLVHTADGSADFFISVLENIHRRKQAEEALRDSEARLKLLVDNVPDILYQFSTRSGGLYHSSQVSKVLGVSAEYLQAHPDYWPDAIHPEDRAVVDAAIQGLYSGKSFAIEYRIRDVQGHWHWLYDRSLSFQKNEDELIIQGLAMDITERKQREAAIEEADLRFQDIANHIPGVIFQYLLRNDGSDSILEMSDGSLALWEMAPDVLLRDSAGLWEMVLPEDRDDLFKSVMQSKALLTFWSHEWRIRTPSGKVKWLNGTGNPRRLENGDTLWNSVIIDVTSERVNRAALDSFFEQNMNLNMIGDLQGRIVRVNGLWEEVLGYSINELQGSEFMSYVHPDDVVSTQQEVQIIDREGISSDRFENRYRHKDGHYRLLSWSSRMSKEDGLIYAAARDITESRQAEKRLQQAATVFSSTAEGVMITDTSLHILQVNEAFEEITGYRSEEIVGQTPRILRSGRHQQDFYQVMWHAINETGSWRGEIWNRRKNGEVFPQLLTISSVFDEDSQVTSYVGAFTDISSIKKHQQRMDYLAHHDPLTGVPNRLLFHSELRQAIRRTKRQETTLALVLIDLDRFKHINDSLGHAAGDALLVEIVHRFRSVLRSDDILARLSGDEFVVLLDDIDGPKKAAQIANSLLKVLEKPFAVSNTELSITASLGLSLCPQDTDNASTLLSNADAAMFKAKDEGRNTYLFYSAEFTSQAFEFVFLENALQKALEAGQFFLVYQPQYDLTERRMVGMEALIRWRHPDQGMIAPDRFIPIAEQSGLIRRIGRWVLEKACSQGRQWLDAGYAVGRIAVNVAGPQFNARGFVDEVTGILKKTGFPAHHLELEVTESFVMKQTESVIEKLRKLQSIGIEISIDDFGTGYSSLTYLKKLPIDKLKIDRSFVRDIPDDRDDMAISRSIVALAEALKLQVIVEGIETEAQADFFNSFPGVQGQGYLFSKPLTVKELQPVLEVMEDRDLSSPADN